MNSAKVKVPLKQEAKPLMAPNEAQCSHISQVLRNSSHRLEVTHLGPMSSPTKLISGYSSCGIITLSLTRVAGGLRKKKLTAHFREVTEIINSSSRILGVNYR